MNIYPKAEKNPWLVKKNLNPKALVRLYCLPYAGGNAMIYRMWPEALPPDIEVVMVQLPGRGDRLKEEPYFKLEPLVEKLAGAIELPSDKPYVFFGHSMGALICFELARYLRKSGERGPKHLFVSGRSAPQLTAEDKATYDLPEDEFVQELASLNGTPNEVLENPELMRLMIPILRADFSVCQTYVYNEELPLDCSITAFGGLQDSAISREKLEAWQIHTNKSFKLRMLPGDHFFINGSRYLLIKALSQELYSII